MFNIFTKGGIISFLYTLPILLFSISVHEFFHAFVAYKLGDKSQKYMGRMSLDPLKHIDILGFISIVLLGFGWGKPVMVDDRNFKNKSKDMMLVSLAGPVSNFVLSAIFVFILKILEITGIVSVFEISEGVGSVLLNMLILAVEFNVIFAVFNLIPLPPLDGSKILRYFLPIKAKVWYDKIANYSFWIIIALWITGLGSDIISPVVKFIFSIINKIL